MFSLVEFIYIEYNQESTYFYCEFILEGSQSISIIMTDKEKELPATSENNVESNIASVKTVVDSVENVLNHGKSFS